MCDHTPEKHRFCLVEYSTTFCVAIARVLVVKLREEKSKKALKILNRFKIF